MNRIVIGIDISKNKFDAAFMDPKHKWQKKTFENNPAGFKVFLSWLREKQVENFYTVMEATGRYGEGLANFLFISGYKVSIINPAQIKYYSRSLLRRTKTDKVDCQLIAEFSQRHELSDWQPLSPSLQSLKDQVRCLEAFKKDATQVSNRLEHAKDHVVKKMLKEHLNHIQNQIDALTLIIQELVRNDQILSHKIELLMSIPGIAETTALKLLGELPNLSTFNCAKQLAAYAGLNPSIKISGASVKGKEKISKTGSRELRKILFFPAMTLMRHPSSLSPFIERMRIKGKKGKVIVTALMRKILHIIFGVLKTQTIFQGGV